MPAKRSRTIEEDTTLTIRLSGRLKDDLQRAADRRKVSLGREVRDRLRESFPGISNREWTGAAEDARALSAAIEWLSLGPRLHSQKSWLSDLWTFRATRASIMEFLASFEPQGDLVPPTELRARDDWRQDPEEYGKSAGRGAFMSVATVNMGRPSQINGKSGGEFEGADEEYQTATHRAFARLRATFDVQKRKRS